MTEREGERERDGEKVGRTRGRGEKSRRSTLYLHIHIMSIIIPFFGNSLIILTKTMGKIPSLDPTLPLIHSSFTHSVVSITSPVLNFSSPADNSPSKS